MDVFWLLSRPLRARLSSGCARLTPSPHGCCQEPRAAGGPFWSPDSRFIGFFAQGKLKKIEISGGPAVALCDVDSEGVGGGTWNRDGVILFSPGIPMFFIVYPPQAGRRHARTTLDPSRRNYLSGGLNSCQTADTLSTLRVAVGREKGGINVASLDSKETKRILNVDSNVVYAPPGYLLFVREGTLLAQPFDAKRFEIMGDPVSVAEHCTEGHWLVFFCLGEQCACLRKRQPQIASLSGLTEAGKATRIDWRARRVLAP